MTLLPRRLLWALAAILLTAAQASAQTPPTLDKVFAGATIGPGGVSTATFTINNLSASPVTDLAFTDVLPVGVAIATPANAQTSCPSTSGAATATISAPDGGTTIGMTDGAIPGLSTCTATVDVTSSTVGTHTNPAITLNSSAGPSMSLATDLVVAANRPGFTKLVSASPVNIGQTVTVTYTIDNTANTNIASVMTFSEIFQPGLEIANPANASSTCNAFGPATVTATAGGNSLTFSDGSVAAGATCTVAVDLMTTGSGSFTLLSGDLTSFFTSLVNSGRSSAPLTVNTLPAADEVFISKSFSGDPVLPGGTATLTFNLRNSDRDSPATNITFTDDLDAMLTGVTASGLPTDPCGSGSSLSGTSLLTLTNGTLGNGGTCTFSVTVNVPGGATPGSYPNQTSFASASIDGATVVGTTRGEDTLVVEAAPALLPPTVSIQFLSDPVLPNTPVSVRYTLFNPNAVTVSGIDFDHNLADITGGGIGFDTIGMASATPVSACGGDYTNATNRTLPVPPFPFIPTPHVDFEGGSLTAGETCSFDVPYNPGSALPDGIYPTSTSSVTATTPSALTGPGGGASFTMGAGDIGLSLTKSFTDTETQRGASTEISFTLTVDETGPATNVSFDDPLEPFFPGTTFGSIVSNGCGFAVTGTSTASFTGGSVGVSSSCTTTIAVTMGTATTPSPAADDGTKTNTTSDLTATLGGTTSTLLGTAASDTIQMVTNLSAQPLMIAKEFTDSPAVAGGTANLRFTITNPNPVPYDATAIAFTDDLNAMLTGAAGGAATVDTCGGTETPGATYAYSGGTLTAGQICTIEIPVSVPGAASAGAYNNSTSPIAANINNVPGTTAPVPTFGTAASNWLQVIAEPLLIAKSFLNDPVAPGGVAQLEFTLTNISGQTPTNVAFTDDLGAMLTGAQAISDLGNTCGGSFTTPAGVLAYTGGTWGPAETCTITVGVQVPGGAGDGDYVNTSSDITGEIDGAGFTGNPATDTLTVSSAPASLLTFSKAFSPGAVLPGETADLTFTITNANEEPATELRFSDDLTAMVPGATLSGLPAAPCGAGSTLTGAGGGVLTLASGTVAPSDNCSFSVTVSVPANTAPGSYPNTTSNLTAAGLPVAGPATASLSVNPLVDISVTKTDGVTSAVPGQSVTYTIVVANAGPAPDPSVSLADTFPAGLTCSYTSVAAGGATGNTAAGAGNLAETLSMPAGSSATYTATCAIPASATGTLSNTATATASVTENVTGNNSATDNDTVLVPEADLAVTKTDGVTSAVAGQGVTYTIVAQNNGPSDEPGATLTDSFPADLTCTYTSVAAGGASGNTAAGAGNLSETLALPVGASVTYTASCAISPAATGILSNTASIAASVTDPVPGNNSATDGDTAITQEADLAVTKTDGVTSVVAGQGLTYTIVAQNNGPSNDPGASLTDSFPAGLTCSYTSTAAGGASGNTAAGSGDLSETIVLPVGSSVTYTASCAVPSSATGTLSNTATIANLDTLDPVQGNNSATDGDTVVTQEADLAITKDDGVTSVNAGGSVTYTITAQNNGPSDEPSASVADTFPADLTCSYTSTAAGGASGNTAAGAGNLADTLSLPSGSSVTYLATCTVDTMASGTLSNTATVGASVTDPAVGNNSATDADTAIIPGDLILTKAFGPATIVQGDITTLTFTLDNSANVVAATSMAFSDPLPGGVTVASPSNAGTTCTGGTLNAVSGSGTIGYSGGSVAAGATCTVSVDVRAVIVGGLTNTSSTLTSNFPEAAAATAPLTVTPAPAPGFAKVFSPDTIVQGDTSVLTFTIDNSANLIEAVNLAFTDNFPPGMVVAPTPAASNTCGGTFTAVAGATSVAFVGGGASPTAIAAPEAPGGSGSGSGLAAGATCTLSVTVRGLEAGPLVNTSGDLTSSITTAAGASDTLTVLPAGAPGFAKAFAPDTIDQGQTSVLTFTIDNSANLIEATDLAFTDNFPTGMVVAPTPAATNTCNGTFAPTAGDASVSLAGGDVAEGATCTLSVTVRALGAGPLPNTTDDLTSSIATATGASATLTVNAAAAPGFAKVFAPDTIDQGQTSVLTFTIDNSANAIEADALAFTDNFPAGMAVATTPAVSNTCGGSVTAAAGAGSVALTGGNVAEGATCAISVNVQALGNGALDNVTGDLTSSITTAGPASDTLNANAVPLTLSKAFAPSTIQQFQTSTMTISMRNAAVIAATSVAVTDTLPAGVTIAPIPAVATTCGGGTLSAPAGGSTLTYTGGTLAAGDGCTVTVNVTSSTEGTYPDATDGASSTLGTSTDVSATLTVEAATEGTVTIVQNSDTDGTYGFSSALAALTFAIEVNGGTGNQGPVPVAAGSYSVALAPPTGVALTGISCDDTDSRGDLTAKVLTLNVAVLENVTCTITAQSSLQKTIDTINRFLTKRADLILSSEPNPNRRFERLRLGWGTATRASWAPGDLKAFLPFTAQVSRGSGEYRFSTSLLQARQAAASVKLAHGSSKDVAYVDNFRFDAWFEAQYKEFDSGAQGEGHFAVAYLGADYMVTPDLLVGALISIDDMEDISAALGTSASGTGWMVGPYMTARLAPNLYFDARIAGGASTNSVSPFNTYTDSFSTQRWMAMASLTGEFQRGAWSVRPNASLSYYQETQDSYVDSTGASIPSQTIELGQLQIGPTFTGRFEGDNGEIYSPYFSVDAIYNLGSTSGVTVTNPSTPSTEGWRGRLKAGVSMTADDGTRLSFGGTYDGLFRSGFEAWGLDFEVSIPLKKARAR